MKAAAFWHNKVPRRIRFWGVVHLLFRAALIAAAPAAAAYYGTITWTQASVVAAVLVALNIASTFADQLSKSSDGPADFAMEGLVRVGDLLSTYKPSAVRGGDSRETAIGACLGIIESIALAITKARKGEISVALILYTGTGGSRMRVRKRNPGNLRPANREFDTERILGHHACQHGDAPQLVNHIGHFGKEFAASPTQTRYNYKAILLIPLFCDTEHGPEPRGFVSIDCDRPYAFYGNRAIEIRVMCGPILGQLREMV